MTKVVGKLNREMDENVVNAIKSIIFFFCNLRNDKVG
jgi:hypothetical protein